MISTETYDLLKRVRTSTTVSLQPTPGLRQEISTDSGSVPFKLRYYQVQGVFHLVTLKRMVLGDDTGIGKTCQTIAAMAYISQLEPGSRYLIVAPKSACRQWADEIDKFSVGFDVKLMLGSSEERSRMLTQWVASGGVLITNYALLVRDWDQIRSALPRSGLVVVYDECAIFRNGNTKTHAVGLALSKSADRCYGLTATLLTSELLNGYWIFRVVVPGLFGTKTSFVDDYCQTRVKRFGSMRVREIVGYKNLDYFRRHIDPVFLGRSKYDVASELPKLITKKLTFELSASEEQAYASALEGVVELANGEVIEYTAAIAALSYCQQIVDGLMSTDRSSKESLFLDLITEELADARVIVYSRSTEVICRLTALLQDFGIESTTITGELSERERRANQERFQDLASSTRVILITDAAAQALNLQSANALVFYDSPWTWGWYVQILGRPIRIGSAYDTVVAYHLVAERPWKTKRDRKTIDGHVLEILQREKSVIESVLGESAVGALEFEASGVGAIVKALAASESKERS